jgi:hypothetical protein
MQMIERILLNFKPGVSQSSLSVFWFLVGNQPRHRAYDVDSRWYREFVTRNTSRRAWTPRGWQNCRRHARPYSRGVSCIVASFAVQTLATAGQERLMIEARAPNKDLLCFVLIRGNHEPFNRLALNESIHNLRDVRDGDASVKKVIGFD